MGFFSAVFAIFSLWSITVSASQPPTTLYDMTDLVNLFRQIPVLGGRSVKLASELTKKSRVIFEDLYPRANWEHPAIVRVLSESGVVLEEIPVSRPPIDLEKARILYGPSRFGEKIHIDVKNLEGAFKLSNPFSYHALLINGRADQRHWNDFSFLFQTVTRVYGYKKSQIYVADSVHKQKDPDLDRDGENDILFDSTLEGIRQLLLSLQKNLKTSDHLLVVVNDHGALTVAGDATIFLFDGEMTSTEFSEYLKKIPAGQILSLFEQCFSGAFVRPTVGKSRVSMAASRNDEYSWATQDMNWDEFLYHATSAFAGQTHAGVRVESDLNQDKKISAQEAFAYAIARTTAPESPFLESHTNSGNAFRLGIGF